MSGNDFTLFVDDGREQVQRSVERTVRATDVDERADPPAHLKAPTPPLPASQQQIVTQIVKMFDEDLEQDGRKELMRVLTAKYRELYG